ncbi:homeobox protein ceh-37-like [Watersipora subatra]|uniref:homeobox protein ceh-37-like n=1 Tax=Watersipora subatra TaxID=2589382 RepID=UPI00355B343A
MDHPKWNAIPEEENRNANRYQLPVAGRIYGHRRTRTVYSAKAVTFLEQKFLADPYPDYEERVQIANSLSVNEARIQVWFQNKRSRSGSSKLKGEGHGPKRRASEKLKCVNSPTTIPKSPLLACPSASTNQTPAQNVSASGNYQQFSTNSINFHISAGPSQSQSAASLSHAFLSGTTPERSSAELRSRSKTVPSQPQSYWNNAMRRGVDINQLQMDNQHSEEVFSFNEPQFPENGAVMPTMACANTQTPRFRQNSLDMQLNSPSFYNTFSPLLNMPTVSPYNDYPTTRAEFPG